MEMIFGITVNKKGEGGGFRQRKRIENFNNNFRPNHRWASYPELWEAGRAGALYKGFSY